MTKMTRAELAIRLCQLKGMSNVKFSNTPFNRRLFGNLPDDGSKYGPQRISLADPTRDLTAAWALKEWLQTKCLRFDARSTFTVTWCEDALTLCGSDAQELAEWICCTVYFAVTGDAVELEGE